MSTRKLWRPASGHVAADRVHGREIIQILIDSDRKTAVWIAMTAIVSQGLGAVGPLLVGSAVDRGVIARDAGWIIGPVVAYFGLAGLSYVIGFNESRLTHRFAQDFMRKTRNDLLSHLFYLDLDFFVRQRSGDVVGRLTFDVENLQRFSEWGLSTLVRAIVLSIMTLIVAVPTSPVMTLVIGILLLPMLGAARWFSKRSFPRWMEYRHRMGDVIVHVSESIKGTSTIKANAQEDAYLAQFEAINRKATEARLKAAIVNARYYPIVEFLRITTVAGVVAIGAILANAGAVTPGIVVAFSLYAVRLFEPLEQLAGISGMVQQAGASFREIINFLSRQPAISDSPSATTLREGPGAIEAKSVSFRYREDAPYAVRNVSFRIAPGEKVALVGPSGAGKSTLVKLLAHFYDPQDGVVLVDGEDVRDVTATSLRARMSLVPQEGFMFSGSLGSNIAVSNTSLTRADIEAVCREIGLSGLLHSLPQGLDTPISDLGTVLSPGQRQLVSLARALISAPRIILLDEATANIDQETEELLQHAIRRVLAGRTAVVIAHRLSTAMSADRILFLEHGEIKEAGTPPELLAQGGRFSAWAAAADQSVIAPL